MNGTPVISIKRKTDPNGRTKWHVIVRGEIYEPARLATSTDTLGQALTIGEMHLRWWGYTEIEVTKAVANAFRNVRRRYGPEVFEEAVTETQKIAAEQAEPYPD